jgi:hypothetical protein
MYPVTWIRKFKVLNPKIFVCQLKNFQRLSTENERLVKITQAIFEVYGILKQLTTVLS